MYTELFAYQQTRKGTTLHELWYASHNAASLDFMVETTKTVNSAQCWFHFIWVNILTQTETKPELLRIIEPHIRY